MRIEMTAERLRAMLDNSMALYWTPGAQRPYWAAAPEFQYDVCFADPYDFLDAAGFDSIEGFEDDEVFMLEVERP